MRIMLNAINSNYYNNYKYTPNFQGKVTNIPKETLVKFIEKDYSIKQIAETLGVEYYEVYPNLKKYGLQTSAMREYEELKTNIVDHLLRGETTKEIISQYEYINKDKVKQAIKAVLNKKDADLLKEEGKKNKEARIQKINALTSEISKKYPSSNIKIGISDEFSLIKSYLLKGYGIMNICKKTGMYYSKVRTLLIINNYSIGEARATIALQWRKDGMSDEEIAQKLKISVKYLNHIIAKYQ